MSRLSLQRGAALALLTLLACAAYTSRPAQAVNDFAIDWYTIDGGGVVTRPASGFALSGTVGQPDSATMTGGTFALAGGFWGGIPPRYPVNLPHVVK